MGQLLIVDKTTITAMKLTRKNLRIVLVDDDENDCELLRVAPWLRTMTTGVGSTNIITIIRLCSITAIMAIGATIKAESAFLSTSEQTFQFWKCW
jgi:hypothetical protein